jgi:adenosylcobinamide kinase/adenosylcobinamide-phosphate guanylyltransferase
LSADLILILGGARSGKSTYAESLAADTGRHVLYVATAEARDQEMAVRIEVSNILLARESQPAEKIEKAVQTEIEAILAARKRLDVPLIVVSNEVGLGLVPPYAVGRLYRDVLGRANQQLAAFADRVLFMVAGLPLIVKGKGQGT